MNQETKKRVLSPERMTEALKRNKPRGDRPVIGICFDWRLDDPSEGYYYYRRAIHNYSHCVEEAGGQPHLLHYDDIHSEFIPKLDGYLFTGGSDIPPKFYGEENDGSILLPHSEQRYLFQKAVYDQIPRDMPVLGICLGFQFLNVVEGGNLLQHIDDEAEHNKKRTITFKKGSLMHRVYGDTTIGQCFHHQSLKRVADAFEVTGLDDVSGTPHAIELRQPGRKVYGVLFHPEFTFKDEAMKVKDEHALLIYRRFVDDCREFKRAKEH